MDLHDDLGGVGVIMIGDSLHVNRQMPTNQKFFDHRFALDMEKPPEGGLCREAEVVDLDGYRRKAARPESHVNHTDDRVLILMRQLAPGVDDRSLSGILDRVARAWRVACAASGEFADITG